MVRVTGGHRGVTTRQTALTTAEASFVDDGAWIEREGDWPSQVLAVSVNRKEISVGGTLQLRTDTMRRALSDECWGSEEAQGWARNEARWRMAN